MAFVRGPKSIHYYCLSIWVMLVVATSWQPVLAGLQVILPIYNSPDASWLGLISVTSAPTNRAVTFNIIINVANGPGTSSNLLYVNAIKRLRVTPNVRIIGYVATGNGHGVTPATIIAKVNTWIKFYGASNFDGFFLDQFLPYGVAPDSSTNAVLANYATVYKAIKALNPKYLVFGGVPYVDARFKKTTVKIADIITVYQAARSYLAYPTDPAQGSLANVPSGYIKAVMVSKIVLPIADANQMLSQMVKLAKSWGIQYFGAYRDITIYPADIFQSVVNLCK